MITERCPPPDWDEIDEVDAGAADGPLRREREGRETFRVALAERVDYLMTAVAGAPDALLTPQDAKRLRRLCDELELPERETERVLAAASTRRVDEPAPTRREGSKAQG